MGESTQSGRDPVWDLAWSWVLRQHERDTFDAAARAELTLWLAADPSHRHAYDKAGRLWLAAGLVPPENDIEIPGADGQKD